MLQTIGFTVPSSAKLIVSIQKWQQDQPNATVSTITHITIGKDCLKCRLTVLLSITHVNRSNNTLNNTQIFLIKICVNCTIFSYWPCVGRRTASKFWLHIHQSILRNLMGRYFVSETSKQSLGESLVNALKRFDFWKMGKHLPISVFIINLS